MTTIIQNLNLDTNTSVLVGLGITLFSYSMYCFMTKSIPLGYKTIYFSSTTDNTNADNADQGINIDRANLGDMQAPTEEELLQDFLQGRPIGRTYLDGMEVISEEELLQDFLQGRPIGGANLEEPAVPNEEVIIPEFLPENNIDDFILDETPVPTFAEILFNILNHFL
jgi:hypothetical protein